MSDDQFNISVRRFLKTVGITSQQKIEEAVLKLENSESRTCNIHVQLICDDLDLNHHINGQIELPKQ